MDPSRGPGPTRGSIPVDQGHEVEPSGGFTPSQRALREQLCARLAEPGVRAELADLVNEDDIAAGLPWRLYRELGSRGWLAPHWPARYGGLGLSWAEAAVVAEELALHGVADTAIVNGIYNVGECLLAVGTPEQRQRFLPGLANGDLVATVLLTEPEAGSDLAALATIASAHDGGWVVTGNKVWTAQSRRADVALCAARTGPGSGYAGVSLFLVPMRAAGVRVSRLDTVNVEALYAVELDGLRLPAQSLVGEVGDGWSVLVDALVLERAGLGYQGRARRWLQVLSGWIDEHPDAVDPVAAQEVALLRARVRAGRELAWQTVRKLLAGGPAAAATAAAMAKWYNTRTGTDVTVLAQAIGADLDIVGGRDDQPDGLLAAAAREAMGLELAAGTSEMMLTIVQSDLHRLLETSS